MRKLSKSSKPSTMLGRVKKLEEVDRIITALFYGRSGTGKTTIAGTFPKPLLILDIGERGTDSLDGDGIDTLQINTWGEFEEVYWELRDTDHGYKTVVIDAIHSVQTLAIQEARDVAKKSEKDPTSQRDFGQASGLLNTWIYNFRDLRDKGIHILFLAHDRLREVETDDDTTITPEVGPKLMPGVAGTLLGAVNVVGYTYIREETTKSKIAGRPGTRSVQYCLRVGPHGVFFTKIRKPKDRPIPEYITDPSYDKLISVIRGTPVTTTKRTLRKGTK